MDAKTTAKGNIYGISRTTVTWDNTNVFIQANSDKIVDKYHTTQTFEGIEISMSGTGQSLFVPYSGGYAAFMFPSNSSDIFTFKAPSGKKFTKIEIIDNDRIYSMNVGVWTLSEDGKSTVWSGTASSSVALTSTDSYEISSIVFTFVDAE